MRAPTRPSPAGKNGDRFGLAALGVGALAVVCCAAGPALVVAFGSLALGSILGIGAGIVAVVVGLAALVVVRRRRQRADPDSPVGSRS